MTFPGRTGNWCGWLVSVWLQALGSVLVWGRSAVLVRSIQVAYRSRNIEMEEEMVWRKSCSYSLQSAGNFFGYDGNMVSPLQDRDESMCKPSKLKEVTVSMVHWERFSFYRWIAPFVMGIGVPYYCVLILLLLSWTYILRSKNLRRFIWRSPLILIVFALS